MTAELSPKEMDEQMAAYECQLATCESMVRGVCQMHMRTGDPDNCQCFVPVYLVRIARRDDGSIYCSRTEQREYLDETLSWRACMKDAKFFADRMRKNDAEAAERRRRLGLSTRDGASA